MYLCSTLVQNIFSSIALLLFSSIKASISNACNCILDTFVTYRKCRIIDNTTQNFLYYLRIWWSEFETCSPLSRPLSWSLFTDRSRCSVIKKHHVNAKCGKRGKLSCKVKATFRWKFSELEINVYTTTHSHQSNKLLGQLDPKCVCVCWCVVSWCCACFDKNREWLIPQNLIDNLRRALCELAQKDESHRLNASIFTFIQQIRPSSNNDYPPGSQY